MIPNCIVCGQTRSLPHVEHKYPYPPATVCGPCKEREDVTSLLRHYDRYAASLHARRVQHLASLPGRLVPNADSPSTTDD